MRRAASLLAAAVATLAPAVALACPSCTVGRSAPKAATVALLAGYVMIPFLLTAIVYAIVRRSADSSR